MVTMLNSDCVQDATVILGSMLIRKSIFKYDITVTMVTSYIKYCSACNMTP